MKNIQTLDQIKTRYYGEVGSPERDRLENELKALKKKRLVPIGTNHPQKK